MRHILLAVLLVFGVSILQACQVKPLYSTSAGTESKLLSVGINPADDRVEQVLRNRLIFMFSGGKGEPAHPDYTLDLAVAGSASAALREQLTDGITAQRYSAIATYSLRDNKTKEIIGSGKRTVVTFYDQTTQEFANRRALRDAEDRAAGELAEIIRADTAALITR
ncbi:LPS assembly lipoprotein LptE [Hoeflea prorocentri]|uniref:LPS assembly lipoprotein LptE n=1 Tax=Hoeflea prorocentri TaxID=1922333 RepID=A0A9X3UML3_9HYPH|nr:LPS assembly lipoprotein LptE [Hoeflea prorocentri]MCY6383180.1 LPS assembly lipoprotein LptE [Hoeflea prorocentri]MDA5400980.1 LPS assembly lipoprotein LptE [Hoeflea prorocentri]